MKSSLKIVMVGAPGSGKGTQASRMTKELNIPHISTGEIFREYIANKHPLGNKIKEFIDQGALVPDDVVLEIVSDRIGREDCKKGFIFDGFPRTIAQAEALKEMLKARGQEVSVMLDLEVPEDELMTRLIKRGQESGRADDNEETIKKRLEVYHRQTQPVAIYYLHQDNYFAINGNNTMEDVFAQICHIIDLFM